MERILLQSKAVVAAAYDARTHRLELEFAGGRRYEYFDVPPAAHEWLLRVADKGAYVTRMISPRYRYRELSSMSQPAQDLESALAESLRALRAARGQAG